MISADERIRRASATDEVVVRVVEDLHGRSLSVRLDAQRVAPAAAEQPSSNSVRDTKTAVNTLVSRPMVSVVAKPRIGPVPNWNRNAAAMSDATWVSRIVQNTRSKPAATAAARPCRGQLFLDALEDQHVRVDAHADRQDEAGDAGQRHGRAEVGHQAEQDQQVHRHRDDRVDARQLVVDAA